jgi:hypothetical protein
MVVETVNCVLSRILPHGLFRAFLEEFRANRSELFYHTEVPWSSSARVWRRCAALREGILQFLEKCQSYQSCTM